MCPTFDDFVDDWKKKARINIGEGWRICQDQVIEAHIKPYLTGKRIACITPVDISDVINASVSKGHSANTTKKIYMVMSKIFNDAVHFFEILNRSPVKKRFHLPKVTPTVQPSMNYLQSWSLLEYTINNQQYGTAIWLQTLAGLRISEVQGLDWNDLNFDKDTIFVQRCWNKHTRKMQPFTKNKTHFTVPIPPSLRKFLLAKRRLSGFICTGRFGGMMHRQAYTRFLSRVCKKLSLPIKSSHGLRHSCARIYAELGATDADLQRLLGHKSSASTKTYIHRDDKKLWELSKKIS